MVVDEKKAFVAYQQRVQAEFKKNTAAIDTKATTVFDHIGSGSAIHSVKADVDIVKTPLASLREGAELLADEVAGPLSADQKDMVAILDSSRRHLQQLIEQLLDYNRRLVDRPCRG